MKAIRTVTTVVALGWMVTLGTHVRAATWAGGTGDWTSAGVDNWGLGVGNYPGGGAYTNPVFENALMTTAGLVKIKAGDWIDHRGVAQASPATMEMTGGVIIESVRIDVRTRMDLLGGTITGNGWMWVSAGGVWNVDGGELGTRLSAHVGSPLGIPTGGGNADTVFDFVGTGNGTLIVTENGNVDLHSIRMHELTAGGNALVEAHGVVPNDGDLYKRAVLFWYLYKNAAGGSSTAKFVLSDQGITPWRVFSQLDLGTGANRGQLDVDVSALQTSNNSTTNFTLFDLGQYGTFDTNSTFGLVTIHSNGEVLDPGPEGNLGIGQYFLKMNGGTYGKDIVLYYNIPEPTTAALLGMGLLFLTARRRSLQSSV